MVVGKIDLLQTDIADDIVLVNYLIAIQASVREEKIENHYQFFC